MSWEDDPYLRSTFGWEVDLPGLERDDAERLAVDVERRVGALSDGWMIYFNDPRLSCRAFLRHDATACVVEGLKRVGGRHSENLISDVEAWIDRVSNEADSVDEPEFRIGLRYWSVTVLADDSLAGAQCLAGIAELAPYSLHPQLVDPTEWYHISGDVSTMATIRRGLEELSDNGLAEAMATEVRA